MKIRYSVHYIGYRGDKRVFNLVKVDVISKERTVAEEQIKKRVEGYLRKDYDRVEIKKIMEVDVVLIINL